MSTTDFRTENLRHLCAFYPSISDVCRRLNINRQQFNKYLSGEVRPSPYNLRRICHFFGVSEADLDTPPARFARFVEESRRPRPAGDGTARHPLTVYERLAAQTEDALERYLGYYFRYFYSFGYPGQIIKCLSCLQRRGDHYGWKTVELMTSSRTASRRAVAKYEGVAFCLGDRIFILEHETLLQKSITELVLYSSYENPITYLTGVQTGAPRLRGRKPTASTVLLEYLGDDVDLRAALAQCRMLSADSPLIDPMIKDRIRNDVNGDGYVLEAEEM